ncbi:MAG: DUF2079 domain-containing protein [Leptolyngbyaceae cyanobacterium HOT.MB2.61]|nr:DUF2079 domain-containing protein [Leptolyngbyaceae cyanobacterium HOT.MB2.61]
MSHLKVPAFKHLSLHNLSSETRVVVLLAALFFTVTLVFGLHRYFTFFASYDQGIFNQVFWNNLHGRFFQSSLSSVLSTNVVHDGQVPDVTYRRLGQHFTPALLLWLPIYALAPNAATLVVIQVSLITAGGVVLYALARHYLPPKLSLMLMAGYYGANAVIGPVFSNFHDLCQIPLFIFTLLLALEKRIWWLVWLMAGLTLLVRQDAGVGLFGIGVYMVVSRRFPKAGLAMCILGFGYVVTATNVFMPMFSEDISRRFMLERFGQYTTGDRATTLDILWAIVSNPVRLLANLLRKPDVKFFYLLVQTLPLAFVPFVAPYSWAIASFPLLQLFLQQGESPLAIHIRYAITLVPGLFYGTILWWSQHTERFKAGFRRFWIACIAVSILIAIPYNPHQVFYFAIPTSFQPWIYVSLPRQWEHASHIRTLVNQIPPAASVSATTYIVPHLASRREMLRMPFLQVRNDQREVVNVDYLIADLWQLERYRIAFPLERDHFAQIVPLIDTLLSQNKYGILGLEDKVILMRKGVTTSPELLQTWTKLRQEYQPLLKSVG